jgi:hypothetical protein
MPVPGTKYHKENKYDFKKDPMTGQYTKEKVWREVSVPEESTSVCDIANEGQVNHLLKLSMYEEYDQEKIDADQKEARAKKDPMEGFAVEKYGDKGYAAVDRRKRPAKYAGESGRWVEKGGDIVPFKSELEAFNFVKEEAEFTSENEAEDMVNQVANKKKK